MDPWIPKWRPRVPKWSPQASQMTGLDTHNDTVQHQSPVNWGAGGSGEALRFAAPPKGEQGVLNLGEDFCRICMVRQAPPLPPARPKSEPKATQKIIKISDPQKAAFFAENGAILDPQGHPKISKISKSASQGHKNRQKCISECLLEAVWQKVCKMIAIPTPSDPQN